MPSSARSVGGDRLVSVAFLCDVRQVSPLSRPQKKILTRAELAEVPKERKSRVYRLTALAALEAWDVANGDGDLI